MDGVFYPAVSVAVLFFSPNKSVFGLRHVLSSKIEEPCRKKLVCTSLSRRRGLPPLYRRRGLPPLS